MTASTLPTGRHHAARSLANLAIALWRPWKRRHPAGHRADDAPLVAHIGQTGELPVIDPEPVADPLDGRWQPFEPDRVPAHTYDELAAATPLHLDWRPASFTESWNAAGLRAQLAAEDAEGAA